MEDQTCAICHDHVDQHIKYHNHCKCQIAFHKNCIEQWFNTIRMKSCPICRIIPINNNQTKYSIIISDHLLACINPFVKRIFDIIGREIPIVSLVLLIMYIVLSFAITIFLILPTFIFYFIESTAIPLIVNKYNNLMELFQNNENNFVFFSANF